ncbi:MAG: Rpn family recombination-promoting nuclease/putative transposase [Clostridia bacterium]
MDDLKVNNNEAEVQKVTRLPLTSDYVFKRIFAREENNSMLKDFLEAILNIHISKVEVKNPELTPNMADEKLGILDLKLDIDNERVVDVEMQVSNEHNIKERSSTYLSKLAAEQLKAKQNYKELKKIITINILKYNYLERNSYHSIARMKYEDTNPIEFVNMGYKKEEEDATSTFEMHFIELPKFKEKNPNCNTKLEQWLWLIDGSKEEKEKMSALENEEINKTVKELNKLSQNPEEVAKYEEREWSIMRYNVEMDTNRELGKEEGRKEGKRDKEIEIVKKLYSLNTPIEKIAEIVELSIEEVKKIIG